MAAGDHRLAATVLQSAAGAGLENIESMVAGARAVLTSGTQPLPATAGAKLCLDSRTLTAGAEGLPATSADGARTQRPSTTASADGAQAQRPLTTASADGARTQLPSATAAAVGGHWPLASAGRKTCQPTILHIAKQPRTAARMTEIVVVHAGTEIRVEMCRGLYADSDAFIRNVTIPRSGSGGSTVTSRARQQAAILMNGSKDVSTSGSCTRKQTFDLESSKRSLKPVGSSTWW